VKTRTLIVLSAICGVAIVAAAIVQLLIAH
jgi:hypothetical protein